jgi:hypothetical protein
MLQSDQGISSIRLAEALGVSQPTAWRMGHALRLMGGREQALDGVVDLLSLAAGFKHLRFRPQGREGAAEKLEGFCHVLEEALVMANNDLDRLILARD